MKKLLLALIIVLLATTAAAAPPGFIFQTNPALLLPSGCTNGQYSTFSTATNRWVCTTIAAGTGDLLANGTVPLSADWNAGAHNITASTFVGALTGNASTATALASNPDDCAAGQLATGIAANGNLTCSANPSLSTLNLVGENALTIGTSGTYNGVARFKSGTGGNNYYHEIRGSNFDANLLWILPPSAPGGANYLLNVDADGTMGYTDPASLGGGSGDVTGVGDCSSGACLDGTSDGGTYISLYDGDSNKSSLYAGNSSTDLSFYLPPTAGATGGMIYYSEANKMANLAAGTAGYILKMGASVPEWSNTLSVRLDTSAAWQADTSVNTKLRHTSLSGMTAGKTVTETFACADDCTITFPTVTATLATIGGTVRVPSSTSLPGTCTAGDLYLDTNADTDGEVYVCRATDTWKAIDDDGGAGGTPGGSDTHVQFNDGSSFGGDAKFTFNKTTGAVGITGAVTATSFAAAAAASTGGYIRLLEGSENGTDYSIITGAADTSNGVAPSFTFSGSGAGVEDLTLTASTNLWTWSSSSGALFKITPDLVLGANIELGHATDTTIARVSAGVVSVEGKNVVLEGAATGGLILGDSSPDAAGEIGYDGDLKFYDASASRTVATLDKAQTLTNKTLTTPIITSLEVLIDCNGEADPYAYCTSGSASTLTATQTSRTIINSYGRGEAQTVTLPAAATGMTFIAMVGTQHNSAWKIQRAGSDTITWSSGGTDTTGKTYFQETNQAVGSRVSCITYKSGASAWTWLCGSITGTWATD